MNRLSKFAGRFKARFLSLIAGLSLIFASQAAAQISVDRAIVNFKKGDRPYRNVVVTNSGTEPIFIEAISDVMVRPGFPDEKREPTEELLVTPKRFSVEPQGQRTIRLVLKKTLQPSEGIYRVKLMPQAKEFEEGKSPAKEKETTLKVIFSVGILILGEPAEVKAKLVWDRKGDQLTFSNEGNVSVLLDEIKHCLSEDKECKTLSAQRLYPGNTFAVTIPANHTVSIRKQVGEETENLAIPPAE